MTYEISRRSIAKGAAWAVPAVAVATAAPAAVASTPPNCFLTDAQLNAGVCSAQSIQLTGLQTYATTGGGLILASTSNNFALKSTCNYKGSISVYFYNPSNGIGATVPQATAKLTNGKTFTGVTTLGQIGTLIAQTGVDFAVTQQWQGSKGSNAPASQWIGALITIPFAWIYTAPDGTLHTCMYALQYTMGSPLDGAYATMQNPSIIAL